MSQGHATVAGDSVREGSRLSIRTEGQVERVLWAAGEARRLRAEPKEAFPRPAYAGTILAIPPEQFTTEWQTACLAEPR